MKSGTQVGGYRVVQLLGKGGMGEVWLAEHAMLGRRAAIKVLRPELSREPEMVTRFFNEARAATSISDPGIVQIFDFGHHGDGSAYIVMELLEGETLDRRLMRTGVLAVPDALRIMRQVAGSLGAAHAVGIIHRDLKPENIFLVRDPEVPGGERAKILDFGIAKLVGETHVQTQTFAMMGTPTYMSPEQCRGAGQVDQRADVYSVGCVLYLLLAGVPPFHAEGAGEIIAAHLREPAPLLSNRVARIPAAVDRLVDRCLAKDPADRFDSCAELAAAIGAELGIPAQLAERTLPDAYAGPVISVVTAQTTLSTASGMKPSTPPLGSRSRKWLVGGSIGVAAISGVAAFYVVHGASKPPPLPAPVAAAAAPVPAAVPSPPGPKETVAAAMKTVLASFVAWSHDHTGAACPDATVIAVTTADPWSHPFRITCTDQPGDQIVGLISSGADGVPETADDIASWQLGRDVTDLVHGARWVVAPAKPAPVVTVKRPRSTSTPSKTPTPPPVVAPKKPSGLQLDDNGMPISR